MKTKIKQFMEVQRLMALFALIVLVVLSFISPLAAQTVTQGYGSDEPLQKGMIIRLKKDDATKIESLSQDDIDKMHGVVVDANDAPLTISSDGQKVFVANVGRYDVLVSDQSGPIAIGDFITISAVKGIGMKAGDTEQVVVGRATAVFDGKTNVVGSTDVKVGDTTKKVNIGRVQTDLGIARNPLLKAKEPNMPEVLKRAAESIAGKEVSPAKAYTSVVIFILSAVISGSLMYSGIRNGIISIGRNPLSKKSIVRGMFQVIITGLIIFLSGIFGVYLLLKL
jgi:hypothetical protein